MADPNMISDPSSAVESVDSFYHQRGGVDTSAPAPDAGVADASAGSNHSNNKHFSHHEVEHKRSKRHAGRSENHPKSAFSQAWEASRGKLLQGAGMFAAFGILLSLSVKAATAMFGLPDPTLLTMGLGTAFAGATWLGGNEFFKVYKQARSEENSRLNKTIDAARERLHMRGHSQETEIDTQRVGELGIVGGSLSSTLGTTAFLVEVPNQMLEQAPHNKTIQDILAQGPKGAQSQLAQRQNMAEMSAAERAELTQDVEAGVHV